MAASPWLYAWLRNLGNVILAPYEILATLLAPQRQPGRQPDLALDGRWGALREPGALGLLRGLGINYCNTSELKHTNSDKCKYYNGARVGVGMVLVVGIPVIENNKINVSDS